MTRQAMITHPETDTDVCRPTHSGPSEPLEGIELEQMHLVRGQRSGWPVAVAIHSTRLGPALGGVRMWSYVSSAEGLKDAARLARGMTYKAAAVGLKLGGGKGVICVPPGDDGTRREAALQDFGDLVDSLGGDYVTAEDVGVGPHDITLIAGRTAHVSGQSVAAGGSGDPSPYTAKGVIAALESCAALRLGSPALAGLSATVVGLGRVGLEVTKILVCRGASVTVTDIDPTRRAVADSLGARWIAPSDAELSPCDVLMPCALGGVINEANVGKIRSAIVCGAANNQLADDSLADILAGAGTLYAPDFVANAGGLISVGREVIGYDEVEMAERIDGIRSTMWSVLATAEAEGATPLLAAKDLAEGRLHKAGPD